MNMALQELLQNEVTEFKRLIPLALQEEEKQMQGNHDAEANDVYGKVQLWGFIVGSCEKLDISHLTQEQLCGKRPVVSVDFRNWMHHRTDTYEVYHDPQKNALVYKAICGETKPIVSAIYLVWPLVLLVQVQFFCG